VLHSRLHRYIEAVARHGSIRKASEAIHVAPSAINRQILEFERSLGLALFDRLPTGLRPTSAGEFVLDYIRRADTEHGLLASRLNDLKGLEIGRVRVAASPGLVTTFLPSVAAPFCKRHRRAEFAIDVVDMNEIVDAVSDGDADIGLGFDIPRDPRIVTLASVNQRLGFVARPDHPLAGQTRVRLSDCIDQPLALPHPQTGIRLLLDVAFAESRIEPSVVMVSNSVDVRKQMVKAGAALTVLAPVDVMGEIADGSLVFIPIVDAALPGQTMKLITRARGALEPLQARFVEDLRQAIAALSK
jgi:DNA-binding transcriptional LysR family regulator